MADGRPFLGIDAGGTTTEAVLIAQDGQLLGRGQGGCGNHNTVGMQAAQEAVAKAVLGALAGSTTKPGVIAFGSSGLEAPGDPGVAERLLPPAVAHAATVFDTDALMALEGALGGKAGIVVAAGTGSIAFGRDIVGRRSEVGGWGWRIGDEGSAYWIAARVLNTITKAVDGRGPGTPMVELALQTLQLNSGRELVDWVYDACREPGHIAGVANLADKAAATGDPVAHDILTSAAAELLTAAEAVFRQADNTWQQPVAVSYTGGVFHSDVIRRSFVAGINERGWGVSQSPLMAPVWGAALHAWRVGHADNGRNGAIWDVHIPDDVLKILQAGGLSVA